MERPEGYVGIHCPKPDSADNTPVAVLGEKVRATRTRQEIWEETVRICETQFNLLIGSGMDWRDAATILPTGTLSVNGRPVALIVADNTADVPYTDLSEVFGNRRPESAGGAVYGIRPHLPRSREEQRLAERLLSGDPEFSKQRLPELAESLNRLEDRREELRRSDREAFGPDPKPLDPL